MDINPLLATAILDGLLWLVLWLVYRKQESIYFNPEANSAAPVATGGESSKGREVRPVHRPVHRTGEDHEPKVRDEV